MMKGMTIAFLITLCAATSEQDRSPLVPVLEPGDILLCEVFPKRIVTGTDVTMYQLARLGYSSVAVFQQDTGLKTDGIIGPQTRGKVEETFNRAFPPLARAQTNAPLALTAVVGTNSTTASLIIAVSNRMDAPIRFVGKLEADRDDVLTFSPPVLPVRESFCRHNPKTGLVACGGGSRTADLCSTGTVVQAGSLLQCTITVSRLLPNEDGSVSIDLQYLTSDGASFRESVRCKRPR
jgi:hypothetical protein